MRRPFVTFYFVLSSVFPVVVVTDIIFSIVTPFVRLSFVYSPSQIIITTRCGACYIRLSPARTRESWFVLPPSSERRRLQIEAIDWKHRNIVPTEIFKAHASSLMPIPGN